MLKQITICGKKRTFKNIKMQHIFDFQKERQEILENNKLTGEQKLKKEGKLLGELIDIKPEEFAEITPDEYGLLNQMSQLYTLAATKITEKEMEDYIEDMKLAGVKGQISFMSNPAAFQA